MLGMVALWHICSPVRQGTQVQCQLHVIWPEIHEGQNRDRYRKLYAAAGDCCIKVNAGELSVALDALLDLLFPCNFTDRTGCRHKVAYRFAVVQDVMLLARQNSSKHIQFSGAGISLRDFFPPGCERTAHIKPNPQRLAAIHGRPEPDAHPQRQRGRCGVLCQQCETHHESQTALLVAVRG